MTLLQFEYIQASLLVGKNWCVGNNWFFLVGPMSLQTFQISRRLVLECSRFAFQTFNHKTTRLIFLFSVIVQCLSHSSSLPLALRTRVAGERKRQTIKELIAGKTVAASWFAAKCRSHDSLTWEKAGAQCNLKLCAE